MTDNPRVIHLEREREREGEKERERDMWDRKRERVPREFQDHTNTHTLYCHLLTWSFSARVRKISLKSDDDG